MNKIVEAILAEFSKDNGIEALPEKDRFEYLTSYLTIRRHFSRALDLNDVVIGDGGDTGIDGLAIIVNGALMTDVDQVQEMLDQNGYLEVTFIFVQAERTAGFDGAKIGTIGNGVQDFFRDVPTMVQNDSVKDAAEIRAAIYNRAPSFRKRPSCHIYYVTTGKWVDDANLVARRNAETKAISDTEMFETVSFTPYGADDIMRLHTAAKNAVVRTFTWEQKVKVPSIAGVQLAYLGYLPARDFVNLISDDAGDGIVGGIFYDNVRDWQDYNEVNSGIRQTVLSEKRPRFVLMNNGVTIIARGFKQFGDTLTIENFQIVNGCQTSNVLFDQRDNLKNSDVQVPLRLIWTNDDNVIDSVVTGTNQQTELTQEQIYARTDFAKKLERHFESYPEPYRLHYERRDGQYDRTPVEKGKIVSPQTLIKVFASMFLEEPHVAAKSYKALRSRVGKDFFLESDKLDPYFLAALASYRLEVRLRTKELRAYKSARYHMILAMRLLLDPFPNSQMNSKDMEKRCAAMIVVLADDGKSNELVKKAKGIIDKVCGGDLSRDNVRTIAKTEAILKSLKKFKKG
ncbi:AIPR family protein [Bradyrhizobium sp. 25ACV]